MGAGMRGSLGSRERRREPAVYAEGGAIPGVERPSGVRRRGKTFIFRSFPIIPLVDAGAGNARFRLRRPLRNYPVPARSTLTLCEVSSPQRSTPSLRFLSASDVHGSSGVARSGETFSFVPFRSISFRFLSTGAGMRRSRLRGNDGVIRVNDVCEQCTAGAAMAQWAFVVGWGVGVEGD